LLQCISTLVVFVLSFFFLGQRISVKEWLSLALIAAGIALLLHAAGLPTAAMVPLVVLLFTRGIAQAIQQIVTEVHKANRVAQTFHQTIRVTAMVMGVTSIMFIVVFGGLAYLKSLSTTPFWPVLPELKQFFNLPMFLYCTLVGCLLHAPVRYCEFLATKKISAKYFMAVVSVQPIFTMVYETALGSTHLVRPHIFTALDYAALALVVGGSLALAVSGFKRGAKGYDGSQDIVLDPQVNKVLQNTMTYTLTFTQGNVTKAAQLLGITQEEFKQTLADQSQQLQFTREFVRRVQLRFSEQVAMADPLTGLANRLQFMTALTQKLKGKQPVQVVLLDLNGFKPVNDTYGHAAGDAVLQGVAKRLQKNLPKGALVARLGGDEFALFSTSSINTAKLKANLSAPYKTKFGSLKVTASLGQASAPKDGKTAASLMEAADKRMYSLKKSR
jgi:diguanylate cyclase (GGDEF)-like protein